MISFEDFKKSEIKIGTIVSAEKVEGADKLLKLMFDFGPVASNSGEVGLPNSGEPTQILSGIAEFYDPSVLVGKQVPVIVNLEPRTLRGLASNGMMLAVVVDGKPVLLHPESPVPPGSAIQ